MKTKLGHRIGIALFYSLYFLAVIFLWISIARAQTIGDGLPERAGTTTPVNICYSGIDNSIVCETFHSPDIIRDFASPDYLLASAIDASRVIDRLPTFGLAKFHWWLFGFEILPRVQREYATCVGEIRAYQKLLGVSPLIDEPGSSLYETVQSVREYLVPFEAVQRVYDPQRRTPPTLEDAKIHAKAAIGSVNTTIYHRGLCLQASAQYRDLTLQTIEQRAAARVAEALAAQKPVRCKRK